MNASPESRQRRWSELSPSARRAIVVGSVFELVMTTFALRDLFRRPAAAVRGKKWAWFLACFVQPVGPIAYFVAGRRPR